MAATPLDAGRLEALLESARLLHGARDQDELLGHLLRSIMGRLLVTRGLVALEREGEMCLARLRGLPGLVVGDTFDAAAAEAAGIERVLPIGTDSRPLGLLGLGSPARGAIGTEEAAFLWAQLGLAASGIANARAHEESRRLNRSLDLRVQDLSALLDLVKGLNSSLDPGAVAQLLMLTLAGRWMLRRSALVAWKPGHPPVLRQQGMDIRGLLEDEGARSSLAELPDAIAVAQLPEGPLKERLVAAQGELLLPIRTAEGGGGGGGGGGGLVVLGPRPGTLRYEEGDLEFAAGLVAQASVALANAWHFRETLEKKKLERELELAASIQASLFPAEMPSPAGYDLAGRNRPARQCGGDYYDALPAGADGDERRALLCVADVSGKGLPASLLMSNTQATLRALLGRLPSLCDLAARASELLFATTPANKYVTAAIVELTPATGAARYLSAGHTASLLLKADGEEIWLGSTGAPLGLLPGAPYADTTFALGTGDCLALFSDGVTEAQNEAGEDFGEARLGETLRSSAGQPAEAIVARIFEAIDGFAGKAPQFDDITVMVLKRL